MVMGKWMSRSDQKHVSSGGLYFHQDPREDGRAEMDKMWWVWWVIELAPKCVEHLDGGVMHDTCLLIFHHGTFPRHLNYKVFTSGHIPLFTFSFSFSFSFLFVCLFVFSEFVGFFTSWYNYSQDGGIMQ